MTSLFRNLTVSLYFNNDAKLAYKIFFVITIDSGACFVPILNIPCNESNLPPWYRLNKIQCRSSTLQPLRLQKIQTRKSSWYFKAFPYSLILAVFLFISLFFIFLFPLISSLSFPNTFSLTFLLNFYTFFNYLI